MKKILCLALACVSVALAGLNSEAQIAQSYSVASGAVINAATTNVLIVAGVTNIVGLTNGIAPTFTGTNNSLILPVSEYDNVGFTFQATPSTANTNGIYGVLVYRSFDFGQIWDQTPFWSFTNVTTAANAGTLFQITTNLTAQGVQDLAFSFINTATGGYVTNVTLHVGLKHPKYGALPATH